MTKIELGNIASWLNKFAKKYEASPSLRGSIQLIPGVGSAIHEYFIAVVEKNSKFEKTYLTKEEFNDAVIKELEAQPKFFRGIIVGPHFLHPDWIMERRIKNEGRRSFSLALHTYLEKSSYQPDRDVRLIIRNNDRYLKYLETLVKPQEINILIHKMKNNFDNIMRSKSIHFCCKDVGFFDGVIITEKSYFKYGRTSESTPIESFFQSNDINKIETESAHFDKTFNANYKGRDNEIAILSHYIMSLEKRLKFQSKNKFCNY